MIVSVEPIGDKWGVFEHKNVWAWFWHGVRKWGWRIALYNLIMRHFVPGSEGGIV